jgi:hypothetical protein
MGLQYERNDQPDVQYEFILVKYGTDLCAIDWMNK